MSVEPIACGIAVFFPWWNDNRNFWAAAGKILMLELGFAFSTITFLHIGLRDYLILFPERIRREPLPKRLPWNDPFANQSSGKA